MNSALAAALSLPVPPELSTVEPRTAHEHDDLGRSYLRAGNLAAALTEFRAALDLEPQAFWPNFYAGWCSYRLGHDDDALAAFHACVVLAPDSAECRVNRALVTERLGRNDQAYRDLTRAIELDPALSVARLNRGVLSFRAGGAAASVADLREALNHPIDHDTERQVRYNLALALNALGDRAAAQDQARLAVSLGSAEARALLPPSR